MRHLIWLSLVLFSIEHAPAATVQRHADRFFHNDDNSVTFFAPAVVVEGKTTHFSWRSNPYGVCRFLGLPSYVENSVVVHHSTEHVAVLDSDGKLQGYADDEAIEWLLCTGGHDPRGPSRNYDRKVENDDGSVTIFGPKFGFALGRSLPIDRSSDLFSVCALFGYDYYVGGVEAPAVDDIPDGVSIAQGGVFWKYSKRMYYPVTRLNCSHPRYYGKP